MPEEAYMRLAAFAGFLIVFLVLESIRPRRSLADRTLVRRIRNLGMAAGNSILARLLVPAGVVGISAYTGSKGWGLLNQIDLPLAVEFVVGFFVLDLAVYAQHVVFHKVPLLWRLHRMHHADVSFDVTTGIRFHPVEIFLSLAWKGVVVAMLGIAAAPIVVFEIALNATAMFNHSNWRLPLAVDRWLRWLIVTPDMHRVHHSVLREEHDSNYGFNFPWWDHWFRTYRDQPAAGHEGMQIGLVGYSKSLTFWGMLTDAVRVGGTSRNASDSAEPLP